MTACDAQYYSIIKNILVEVLFLMNKFALIGCGHWGKNYLRVLQELKQQVVYCCDTDDRTHRWIKDTFPNVTPTASLNDIISSPVVTAVVISTPATSHYGIAKQCLLNGKDVLLEKPLTLKVKDAEELIEISGRTRQVMMVAHTFLYNMGIRKMKEIVSTPDFGHIYYMHAVRTHLGLIRSDVNAVWDLAPHDISIFSYLLDAQPVSVSAVGGRFLCQDKEDVAFISLMYPSGIIGNIHVSWADSNKERRVVAVGSKKRVVFDDINNLEPLKIFEKGVSVERSISSFGEFQYLLRDGDIISPKVDVGEPLKIECRHFIECIENRTAPFTDGRSGLEVVKIISAIQDSIKQNGIPISFTLKPRNDLRTSKGVCGEHGRSS